MYSGEKDQLSILPWEYSKLTLNELSFGFDDQRNTLVHIADQIVYAFYKRWLQNLSFTLALKVSKLFFIILLFKEFSTSFILVRLNKFTAWLRPGLLAGTENCLLLTLRRTFFALQLILLESPFFLYMTEPAKWISKWKGIPGALEWLKQ